MAKPEWGLKRICQNCSTKFYDFRKDPIVCPKCGTTFNPEIVLKSRRGRLEDDVEDKKVLHKTTLEDDEGDDEDLSDDDALLGDDLDDDLDGDEDGFIEDPSELGGDEDMGQEIDRDKEDS